MDILTHSVQYGGYCEAPGITFQHRYAGTVDLLTSRNESGVTSVADEVAD